MPPTAAEKQADYAQRHKTAGYITASIPEVDDSIPISSAPQMIDDIVAQIQADVDAFGVNVLAAYNLGFDRRVMRQTNGLLGNGPILPKIEMLDIWQFACETKLSTATYKQIARCNGWVSDKGNIRTGAEYAYRFCSGDHGFIEDHTALSDALIETDILTACYACKKSVPYGIMNAQPWRIVNEK